jgi:hypothetical protein
MKLKIGILAVCCGMLLVLSCKKNDYITDGGLHNPKTPLTTYEYLKGNAWHMFDTLLMVVDHYGLQEEMNSAGTFFAPTNRSINRYMVLQRDKKQLVDENAKYTMDSLYKDITADSVKQYFFADKLPITSLADEMPVAKTSMGNTPMAIRKRKQDGYNQWSAEPVYFLYLIQVKGTLDDPNSLPAPGDKNIDISVQCQTTGIETSNGKGTLLHVLSNTHTFVRF